MQTRRVGSILVALAALQLAQANTATAQPLGTFRWQLQPFCNVVTVAITQNGAVYRLEGTDDQCGAGTASVTGTAFPNADGTIRVRTEHRHRAGRTAGARGRRDLAR